MKNLDKMSNWWIRVANELEIPTFVIKSIQASRLDNDQASLRRVVEWWFKNTVNPEWKVIQQLQGSPGLSRTMQGKSCGIFNGHSMSYL